MTPRAPDQWHWDTTGRHGRWVRTRARRWRRACATLAIMALTVATMLALPHWLLP